MSERALASQEKQAQVIRLSQWLHKLVLTFATLLSLATAGVLVADQLYRPDAFVINQLEIKGKFQRLEPSHIEAIVKNHTLGNFFSIGLDQIEQQIEALAWVQNAEVRRKWPGTLLVRVVEQQPVMRWGADAWVNTQGDVIELPIDSIPESTITLHGHEKDSALMLQRSLRWSRQLAGYGLVLKSLTLSESHAYKLELAGIGLQDTFALQLGRHDVEPRLDRFLELYQQRLDSNAQHLKTVDARYPDGIAISTKTVSNSRLEQS